MDDYSRSTLFIFITNNCNLKCLGCMQSCDRITNPYYITIQELEKYLKILQTKTYTVNNIPVKTIHLTGGDPLTHPNFIELCELTHRYLPNMCIDISTNGLYLNKFSDLQLESLNKNCNNHIHFQLSMYPTEQLLAMYKKIINRLSKLNISFNFGGSSHFFFSKQNPTNFNCNKGNGYNPECYNMLLNQTHTILYKGKIYSCWKDINFLQRKEKYQNEDDAYVLSIDTPTELLQNKKHYYCNNCKHSSGSGGEEFILWQHHNKQAKKIFKHNLKEIYVRDYPLYYSLQHDCKKHLKVLKDELFQKYLSENEKRYANTRFLNGKGDIFIPFDKEISPQVKQYLENLLDIQQYNVYLISINASNNIQEKTYSMFMPYDKNGKLNNYFLKANNLFDAYKTFLNNSYLSNKFIIDIEQDNIKMLPIK